MGLRYGLLAALTLVIASALLWDRMHPPRSTALFPRDLPSAEETVRIVVGGPDLPAPPASLPPAGPGPSPAPEPEPVGEREYTVAAGDTLGAIALATMGTSRKAGELAAYNDMTLSTPLHIGDVLRIPAPAGGTKAPPAPAPRPAPEPAARKAPPPPVKAPPAPPAPPKETARSHRVGKGDTLYGLSRKYYGTGGRWASIAEANGLSEGEPLVVGTTLRIP